MTRRTLAAGALAAAVPASALAQFVLVSNGEFRSIRAARTGVVIQSRGPGDCCGELQGFSLGVGATHGQPVAGGGTLSPLAPFNPAVVNDLGQIAFMAYIDGSARNQAIVLADHGALTVVARGCGQGGGAGDDATCGDPSPIGGKFSGFFGGTFFAPALNDRGDVLFMSDVVGGSSRRGLFFYDGAAHTIRKVAAVGDPSPLGGTLSAVGPGSMNNNRQVVFLAEQAGGGDVNILKWDAGALSPVVAVGDPAPNGGGFEIIAGEALGFVDGTFMPVGAVPAINDVGQVAFFSTVTDGSRGLYVSTGGAHARYVSDADATPVGGTYLNFEAPHLNASGQIAFYADVWLGGDDYTGGWFVGEPGSWRKGVAFYDSIAGGQVFGLAVSRNPIRALDDCGSLIAWCTLRYPDTTEKEALLWLHADGTNHVIAKQYDATPLGGSYGILQPWPTLSDERIGVLSAFTPGAPGGVFNAHFLVSAQVEYTGDLNGDGAANLTDLAILLANFGQASGADRSDGDLDGDGDVDLTDLAILLSVFGTSCA